MFSLRCSFAEGISPANSLRLLCKWGLRSAVFQLPDKIGALLHLHACDVERSHLVSGCAGQLLTSQRHRLMTKPKASRRRKRLQLLLQLCAALAHVCTLNDRVACSQESRIAALLSRRDELRLFKSVELKPSSVVHSGDGKATGDKADGFAAAL